MTKTKISYVYRITNTKENIHYYGRRTSFKHPSQDIGVSYFSSSKILKARIKENPNDFKYKIIKICVDRIEASNLEIKLHQKFNVGKHPKFYNRQTESNLWFDPINKTLHMNEAELKLHLHIMSINTSNALKRMTLEQKEHKRALCSMKAKIIRNNETKENKEIRQFKINKTKDEWTKSEKEKHNQSRIDGIANMDSHVKKKLYKARSDRMVSNNPSLKHHTIYDNNHNVVIEGKKSLRILCMETGLPYTKSFVSSTRENFLYKKVEEGKGRYHDLLRRDVWKYRGYYVVSE